jgi:general secretion pathway protein C
LVEGHSGISHTVKDSAAVAACVSGPLSWRSFARHPKSGAASSRTISQEEHRVLAFHWPAHAIARAAGFLGITALVASSLTTTFASRLLVSDEALAGVADVEIDTLREEEKQDPRAEKREKLLEQALAGQAGASKQQRSEAIVENNIFCPTCKPTPPAQEGAESDESGSELPQTQLPLALLATMESDDPLLSMATILDTEHKRTGVYSVNDPVRPGVVIAGIARGAVVLRASGNLQALGFPEPEAPKSKRKPANKGKSKRKRGSREIPGAREAINCKGNACTVQREFVEKLMANPRLLTRQAKILPAVKDGETRGFRLYRVRRGTLPRLLGLKNGDTLLAVNGTDLDSMDRAISLYTKLRRASELSFTVERKGKVFEKHVSIR